MKPRSIILTAFICLLIALPAWGQSLPQVALTKVNVSVAFDFWVNEQHLPAGDYTLTSDPMTQLLVIENKDTGDRAMVFTDNSEQLAAVAETKLVFLRSGDRNVLHQVWMTGDLHGHDLRHGPEVPQLPPE